MSPNALGKEAPPHGFPRVSGDEPIGQVVDVDPARFSPRERG